MLERAKMNTSAKHTSASTHTPNVEPNNARMCQTQNSLKGHQKTSKRQSPISSIPKQHEDYRDARKRSAVARTCCRVIWFWDQPADQKPKWRIPIFCFKASDKVFWFRIFQFKNFFAVHRKRYSILLLHGRRPKATARCLGSLDFLFQVAWLSKDPDECLRFRTCGMLNDQAGKLP